MSLLSWIRSFGSQPMPAPQAAVQSAGGGVIINTPQDLERFLAEGNVTQSGAHVTPDSAMRVATVYGCVRVRSGVVANMPIFIKRRVSPVQTENEIDHALWRVFRRRPNSWQTPSQFKRMMQSHVLLRGNAYALVVRSRGQVIGLVPMHPDRVEVKQLDNLSLEYKWTRATDGRVVVLRQADVFHLVGLSLDGIVGVSPITYARETIGLAMAQDQHGASMFKNGTRIGNVLKHPGKLGPEGRQNLQASLDEYRQGGEFEGKDLVLEEGMEVAKLGMTSEDAEWLESRKFSRTDISMFYGVPPFLLGITEGSTSWGAGLEQQSSGFVRYVAEDDLVMWEESIERDLLNRRETDIFSTFDREALTRGDTQARWERHVKSLQWGVENPDEIRARENMNPRLDGEGDVYYEPPNASGGDVNEEDDSDDTEDTPGSQAVPATE